MFIQLSSIQHLVYYFRKNLTLRIKGPKTYRLQILAELLKSHSIRSLRQHVSKTWAKSIILTTLLANSRVFNTGY